MRRPSQTVSSGSCTAYADSWPTSTSTATLVLPTFQPERSTDPLSIPAGHHLIEIRTAGAAKTETPLLTQTVTVPAGFGARWSPHLGPTGAPTTHVLRRRPDAGPGGRPRGLSCATPRRLTGVTVLLNAQPAMTIAGADAGTQPTSSPPALRDRSHAARRWRAAGRAAERRVPRRHGQLHVPHRFRVGGHARLGGGPGQRPADRTGADPDRRRQHRARGACRRCRDRPTDRDHHGCDRSGSCRLPVTIAANCCLIRVEAQRDLGNRRPRTRRRSHHLDARRPRQRRELLRGRQWRVRYRTGHPGGVVDRHRGLPRRRRPPSHVRRRGRPRRRRRRPRPRRRRRRRSCRS